MKFAFAAALVAVANAVDLDAEWGYAPRVSYKPVTVVAKPGQTTQAASKGYGADYTVTKGSDWDAWARDQDLSIDESYGKTNAKSYRAESYDEWDNKDADKWGAQKWEQDRDLQGASSQAYAASRGDYGQYGAAGAAGYGYKTNGAYGAAGYGKRGYASDKSRAASVAGAAAKGAYDNDVWAKQAYGSDYDSRWGKSYDSVEAKSYDNENYARHVQADDDQWAEDYDTYRSRDADAYGKAASVAKSTQVPVGYGYGHHGVINKAGPNAQSAAYGAGYWGKKASDWDAWGRDQDYSEKVSYDKTRAKSYRAESYDEWDNEDDDSYGAQAWGIDKDVYGASSYGKAASAVDVDRYGKAGYGAAGYGVAGKYGKSLGYGKGVYGGYAAQGHVAGGAYGKAGSVWQGASKAGAAAAGAYDSDSYAKQGYGRDYDSRWGKSYDSVSAKSYENESYDRHLQADDDQWAEDYDRYDSRDAAGYGRAASAKGRDKAHGWGYGKQGAAFDNRSKAGYGAYDSRSGSDWDAYGRDQDLEVKESYDATWAKSYDAESYDEWDNKDDDKFGAQAWGVDKDAYGASSHGRAASEKDADAYGRAGYGAASASKSVYGGIHGHGHGYGGYGGYGKSLGYGKSASVYGAAGARGYGAEKDYGASAAAGAQKSAYDNDTYAKQAYGSDFDSRWGKSYDSVNAKSYDDEQYARKIRADDDQWAEDRDNYLARDAKGYGAAASSTRKTDPVKKTVYQPVYSYGGYGHRW